MSSQIGLVELVFVGMVALFSLAIPTAVFVMAVLIYRKLTRIEQMLRRRE